MGMVAANAHHSGNARSAINPITENEIQKTFLCIPQFYGWAGGYAWKGGVITNPRRRRNDAPQPTVIPP